MKIFKNYYFVIMFVFMLFVFSCSKSDVISSSNFNANNENIEMKQNEATWISNHDHSKGFLLNLKFFIGHTAEQCGNRCVKILGVPMHLDCRGFGNICNHIVNVEVATDMYDDLILILTDLDSFGDFEEFQFPDRSFFITNPQNNTELWLNIPEQVLCRNSSDTSIIMCNIWFSEESELENF